MSNAINSAAVQPTKVNLNCDEICSDFYDIFCAVSNVEKPAFIIKLSFFINLGLHRKYLEVCSFRSLSWGLMILIAFHQYFLSRFLVVAAAIVWNATQVLSVRLPPGSGKSFRQKTTTEKRSRQSNERDHLPFPQTHQSIQRVPITPEILKKRLARPIKKRKRNR